MVKDDDDDIDSLQLCEENGLGEDSMGNFIQSHLEYIMRPLLRRLDGMEAIISSNTASVSVLLDKTKKEHDAQQELIFGIGESLEKLRTEVAGAQSVVARTATLEGGLQKIQGEVHAGNERQRALQSSVYDLEREAKETTQGTKRLKSDIAMLQTNISQTNSVLMQQLNQEIEALVGDHDATVKALKAAEQFQLDTRKDLLALTSAFEKQVRRDDHNAANATKAMANFEALLKTSDQRVQMQGEHLKATKTTAQTLQTLVEQLHKGQTVLEQQQKDSASRMSDLQKQMLAFDTKMRGVMELVGGDEDESNPTDIVATLNRLSVQIENNTAGIQNLDKMIQIHSELHNTAEERFSMLETSHAGLKESSQKLNEGLVKRIGTLENACSHNEQINRADRERKDKEIAAMQHDLLTRLDGQAHEIEKGTPVIQKNSRDLDAAGTRMDNFQAELKQINEDITKLRATLDLSQQYWKGLAKGFKQTQRSIRDEGTLKDSVRGTMLPALRMAGSGETPARVPSSGSRTPRKDGIPSP